jgi:hypothetical protein
VAAGAAPPRTSVARPRPNPPPGPPKGVGASPGAPILMAGVLGAPDMDHHRGASADVRPSGITARHCSRPPARLHASQRAKADGSPAVTKSRAALRRKRTRHGGRAATASSQRAPLRSLPRDQAGHRSGSARAKASSDGHRHRSGRTLAAAEPFKLSSPKIRKHHAYVYHVRHIGAAAAPLHVIHVQ